MLRSSKRALYIPFRNLTAAQSSKPCTKAVELNSLLEKIRVLSTRGQLNEALSLIYTIQHPHSPKTYATLFHACARYGFLQEGIALHHYMLSHNPNYPFDLYVTNHLINMYCKCGCLDYAYQLFYEMPRRNLVSWTALISGFSQHAQTEECFTLFSRMLLEYRPNEFAFASLISSLGENHGDHGRQVHGLALKMCLDSSIYVANALITMYSKSCSNNGDGGFDYSKDDAWTSFVSMEYPNHISWNSMIAGFCFRKLGIQAINVFIQMHREGIGFDRATLLSTSSSLCLFNSCDFDSGLQFCYELHCLIFKTGFISEIEVATALVKAYSDLGGDVNDCYRLFSEAGDHRDIVSWTGIITAFAEHDPKKAIFLFHQLRNEDLAPDWYTFSIVLKACAELLTERNGSAYHSQAIKAGLENDTILANVLIHVYARCGSITLTEQVFWEMGFRDLVSWNSMLKAYAVHGQANKALQLFSQMNLPPDSATFVALLSACSHAGLVEEGTKLFDSMFKNYGIVHQLDHYACMVDILGRAGRIREAEVLISRMPMKPDSVIWSALLGSCRKHGMTQLAELAADKLKELDPGKSFGYVQMSNIYCSSGSFDKAGLVRKNMKGYGVRKEPGLSWVEIGTRMHEFASGGECHPERETVCQKLESLIGKLKERGYVPETNLALHDIEDEHKEEQLHYHSEKLALVFAVTNESSLRGDGSVIRIMKNIRICVDCHNFMKLVSDYLKKEIVVRDSNRFHHFKAGLCSCNDYW